MQTATWAIPVALVALATVFDLRARAIPDWISILLLAWAAVSVAFGWQAFGWMSAAIGAGIAFGAGAILFRLGGFGGGDVKLLTALGAALGLGEFLRALFFIALAGGILSIVAAVRGEKELAYAPAIAIGVLASIVLRWVGAGGLAG